jgi:hypothetical protein
VAVDKMSRKKNLVIFWPLVRPQHPERTDLSLRGESKTDKTIGNALGNLNEEEVSKTIIKINIIHPEAEAEEGVVVVVAAAAAAVGLQPKVVLLKLHSLLK